MVGVDEVCSQPKMDCCRDGIQNSVCAFLLTAQLHSLYARGHGSVIIVENICERASLASALAPECHPQRTRSGPGVASALAR